jgi:hypothetical protein
MDLTLTELVFNKCIKALALLSIPSTSSESVNSAFELSSLLSEDFESSTSVGSVSGDEGMTDSGAIVPARESVGVAVSSADIIDRIEK